MSLTISFSNIKQIDKVISDLPKCLSASNGGVIILNYVLYQLFIEILTMNIKLPKKYKYDEKRYLIDKSIQKFANYKIQSKEYLKRALLNTLKQSKKKSQENYLLVFLISSQLNRRIHISKNFYFFNKTLSYSNWNYLIQNYDFDKFLQRPIHGLTKEKLYSKFDPFIINAEGSPFIYRMDEYSKPFELLRAIVNFSFQFGTFYIDPTLPLSIIPPSIISPVFSKDGRYITTTYPYAKFDYDKYFSLDNSKLLRMKKLLRYFNSFNQNTKYKEFLADLLIRYSNALDSFDWESVYLALWIILEKIAFPVSDSIIKEVPGRIARISNLDDYSKELIDGLKNIRNKLVHKGMFTGYDSSPILFLKVIVDRILFILIRNHLHFEKLNEIEYIHELQANSGLIFHKIEFYKKYDKYMKSISSNDSRA